jgi:hypothetical protein
MNCPNYNCNDPLGAWTANNCGEELLGGGGGVILLECNHQLTDPSNTGLINIEIAAGRAKLITGVKIGINAPSPVKVDSNAACQNQKLVTYDRTGSYVDGNVSADNVEFYKPIFAGRTFGGLIIWECGTEDSDAGPQVTWIDAVVNFEGGRILPPNNNELQRFEGAFNWRSRHDADIYAAPAGVFA